MVVTWTAVTNPPAAGNITIADDTEVDGSEGIVSHGGGWILQNTSTTTPYEFRILEDAYFEQAGGDFYIVSYARLYMEPGSSLILNGSDKVYAIDIYSVVDGTDFGAVITIQGTSAKHCTIGGTDNANRANRIRFGYVSWVLCKYVDMKYINYNGNYMLQLYHSNISRWENCTFIPGSAIKGTIDFGEGIHWMKNCVFGDINTIYGIYQVSHSILILEDCTFDQTSNQYSSIGLYYPAGVLFTNIIYLNGSPLNTDYFFQDAALPRTSYFDIKLVKLTVSEQNNLSGCSVHLHHRLWEDILNSLDNTSIVDTQITSSLVAYLLDGPISGNQAGMTDISGDVVFLVPYRMRYMEREHALWRKEYISDGAQAGNLNDEYDVIISKKGYRSQSTSYWMSGDQTWNVTLVPETTFTDILDAIEQGTDHRLKKPRRAGKL